MLNAANMYKKAILPLDQSRCFKVLGDFGKAIRILVDSANFDSALACFNKLSSQQKVEVSGKTRNSIISYFVIFIILALSPVWD